MRIILRSTLGLLAAHLLILGGASGAQADELHRTAVGIFCEGVTYEGATMTHRCEALVQDGSAEPTPSTGTMTMNHSIACTPAPLSADASGCEFSLSTPAEGQTSLLAEYSGDATHAGSELFSEWDVGPPDIGWRRGTPPVFGILAPDEPADPSGAESAPSAPGPEASSPSAATEPPTPRMVERPARLTRLRLARFRFVGDGRYECSLDGGAYRSCGDLYRHRVATGAHVLRVRAARGDPVSAFRWRVLPDR